MLSYTGHHIIGVEYEGHKLKVETESLAFMAERDLLEAVSDGAAIFDGSSIDTKPIADFFDTIVLDVQGVKKGADPKAVPMAVKVAVRDWFRTFSVSWPEVSNGDLLDMEAPQVLTVMYLGEPIKCILKSLKDIEERQYVTRYLNDRIAGQGRKRSIKQTGAVRDLFDKVCQSVEGIDEWGDATGSVQDAPYVVKEAVAGTLAAATAEVEPLDELSTVGN